MAGADTALEALKAHNDILTAMLSREGLAELDRLALLQTAMSAFFNQRVNEYQKMQQKMLMDRMSTRLGLSDAAAAQRLAADVNSLPNQGEALTYIKDAINQLVNAYMTAENVGIPAWIKD